MTLLYLGLLILFGFACSRLCKRIGVPSVTGYLIAGLLFGPSAFDVIGPETIATLKPLAAFALATIFFLLGEEFNLTELRRLGGRFLAITVAQALITFMVVAELLLALHAPLPIALLLGAIAGTTDPAATLGVIRELRGKGELVGTLTAIVALNGFVEMVIFNALMPLVELTRHTGAPIAWTHALASPAREFCSSLTLGLILGAALWAWSRTPYGRDNLKLPTIALLLIGSGACEALHLSVLLAMLGFGAFVANVIPRKVAIFDLAKGMEGPLLVMFFTLAGAGLHLSALATVGWLGVAYVAGRMFGKLLGAAFGATIAGAAPVCQRYLGCGLIPQASMAIGLAYIVQERFPDLAGPILPITLGAIVVFEAVGPLLTRFAIIRADEARPAMPITIVPESIASEARA